MNPSTSAWGRRPFVLLVFVLGLLLYAITCAPDVLWQDSAAFQVRAQLCDLRGELGLALAHPTYVLLARIFSWLLPFGEIAYRVNLFSALCASLALAIAADLLLSLTRCRRTAVVGVLMLAVSHTFWRHAVIAEVYSLYAACLVLELWLLHRFFKLHQTRWMIFAFAVCGFNASNHLLALLHLPAYAGVALWSVRRNHLRTRELSYLVGAFIAGSVPYVALIISELAAGQPFGATVRSALFGNSFADEVMSTRVASISRVVMFFGLNFPTPLVAAFPVGVYVCWRNPATRWFAGVVTLVFLTGFLFAVRYLVPDQYVFFFPCYVLVPFLAALGVHSWIARSRRRAVLCLVLAAMPAAVYEFAPRLARDIGGPAIGGREIPYRDNYTYFLRPRQNGYHGTRRFVESALEEVGKGGLLIADSTIMNAIVYIRDLEGLRKDVVLSRTANLPVAEPTLELTPESIDPYVTRGAAVICSDHERYVPQWLREQHELQPSGVVFRIVRRGE